SMGLFTREIATRYEACSSGQASSLPDLPIQYADFAVWQREWLQGEVLEEQMSYWKQQLAQAPPKLELPTDRPKPLVQTFRSAQHRFTIDNRTTQELKSLGNQQGATLAMAVMTAYNILLYRYTAQQDILVGMPISGRNRAEIEGLIGFFLNTLVIRTDLSGAPSFQQLLARVRKTTLEAYAHQDLPFEKLVEEMQPKRQLNQTPLFQVLLIFQNFPKFTLSLPGLTLSSMQADRDSSDFDLTLWIGEGAEGLAGSFEYNT